MKEYCGKCKKKTNTVFNEWMVPFCEECHTRKREPVYRGVAFICRICEGGFDESYPGQTMCNSCAEMLANGIDW